MKNLFLSLLAVAGQNPDGYTVNKKTLQPVTSGYAVAVAETQNSFGNSGLKKVIEYAQNNKEINAFGGWLDTETGLYYFDAVCVFSDLDVAKSFAAANKQIAFFDLTNLVEIRL